MSGISFPLVELFLPADPDEANAWRLTCYRLLHKYRNMEKIEALAALSALAQETRLDIFRLLVKAGADGMPAGHIGEQLRLPSATLAFHLKELKHAGLATCTRNGRSLIYAAAYPTMTSLLAYLTENCCQGNPAACGLDATVCDSGANS